jgi:TAT (twin-arginine translocation) pathway signal sequence
MTSLSPVSRRRLLRGALAVGAAGVVGGVAVEAFTTGASAQTTSQASGEPVVAHVRDVASGDIDLFVGTRLVRIKDPQLAARLAQAAR